MVLEGAELQGKVPGHLHSPAEVPLSKTPNPNSFQFELVREKPNKRPTRHRSKLSTLEAPTGPADTFRWTGSVAVLRQRARLRVSMANSLTSASATVGMWILLTFDPVMVLEASLW